MCFVMRENHVYVGMNVKSGCLAHRGTAAEKDGARVSVGKGVGVVLKLGICSYCAGGVQSASHQPNDFNDLAAV